jgi:dihydropteroate synthase
MLIDPGIGFGKTALHNFELIKRLAEFSALGSPVLIGPSRKSFLGTVLDLPVGERLEGTIAACVASILNGAHVIRVHDVKAAKRAAVVADAIRRAT